MPVLSVIIPTFNAAATLSQALQSLQEQSWQHFDIIIKDGGSADDTLKIAASYQSFFENRLHIYSDSDNGIYDAMNMALERINGEWIYFLGADDYLADENVLEEIAPLFHAGYHLVYGKVFFKNHNYLFGKASTLDTLLFEQNICHQAIFYQRRVFQKVGIFNTRYPIWADWEFNIRCFRVADIQTHYTDRVIAVYNDHTGTSKTDDPVFSLELPVAIHKQWVKKYKALEDSPAYQFGKKWYPLVKRLLGRNSK